jgi:shikimate kinase
VPDNVVLIGFSGTGKSSIGRVLAERLGWPLVDTDDLIVRRFEKCIAAIFREDGEAVFRAAERDAVATACAGRHQVISLGGGAPVALENRAKIRDKNWVVRLEASPEVILHRLRTSPGAEERPMLAGADPLGRIRSLLAARADAYGIADFAVDTAERSIDEVAATIIKRYLGRGA